tara:strand:+ start:275 stop:403 length:129 start_codon:yes stop_codon:yes gene_type:complete
MNGVLFAMIAKLLEFQLLLSFFALFKQRFVSRIIDVFAICAL